MHPSQQYAMAGFWSEVGLPAKAEEVAGQRSVNGNAQVAGRQFYPRSRPWLMGDQIKAERSRSTDDHGLSVLDYGTWQVWGRKRINFDSFTLALPGLWVILHRQKRKPSKKTTWSTSSTLVTKLQPKCLGPLISLKGSQEKGCQGWAAAPGQMVIILFVPEGLTLHSCFFTILMKVFFDFETSCRNTYCIVVASPATLPSTNASRFKIATLLRSLFSRHLDRLVAFTGHLQVFKDLFRL